MPTTAVKPAPKKAAKPRKRLAGVARTRDGSGRFKVEPSVSDRFWRKVNKRGPVPQHVPRLGRCWLWVGGFHSKKNALRYGTFWINGRMHKAHRVSWFLCHGKWPKRLACHKCDNPACIRPSHLFSGSHLDNSIDRNTKGRANAPRGTQHHKAKLTDAQVRKIRQLLASGHLPGKIAPVFGVSRREVSYIRSGTVWSHLS